jgi:Kef-type K+ transport system membrane component KefB
MTPQAMVTTALLLGAMVAAAGSYGLLYCLARLWDSPALRIGSVISYAMLCAIAIALVAFTPLHAGWKVLVAASAAAYLMIPPVTWRHLKRIHRDEDTVHATRPAEHANRHFSGLFDRA